MKIRRRFTIEDRAKGRKTPSGAFFFDGYLGGERVRVTLDAAKTLKQAEAMADEIWGDMKRAERVGGPMQRVARHLTLADAIDRYIADRAAAGCVPTWVRRLGQFKDRLLECFGPLVKLRSIGDARIGEYKTARLARGAAPETVTKELTFLGSVGRYAVKLKLLAELPWSKTGRVGDRSGKQTWTWLSRDEIEALLGVLRDGAKNERIRKNGRPMKAEIAFGSDLLRKVIFALTTGARAGEMARLVWDDVDMGNRSVRLIGTKAARAGRNAKSRVIPMSAALLEMFSGMERGAPGDPVFGRDINLIRRLNAAARWAGIERHLRWHDLRHSFASHLVRSEKGRPGAPLYEVAALMGHSTTAMTQRYAHLSHESLARAVGRLDFGAKAEAAQVIDIAAGA
jgi:integrase